MEMKKTGTTYFSHVFEVLLMLLGMAMPNEVMAQETTTVTLKPRSFISGDNLANGENAFNFTTNAQDYATITASTRTILSDQIYATGYGIWAFDISENDIPRDAKILSVSCKVKASKTEAFLNDGWYTLSLLKDSEVNGGETIVNASSPIVTEIENPGKWTRADLNDLQLRVGIRKITIDIIQSIEAHVYGADLIVTYEKAIPYKITCMKPINGIVNASATEAYEGESVALSYIPDYGYDLNHYIVKDEEDNDIAVDADGKFTMPASNVTVSAEFAKANLKFALKSSGAINPDKRYLIVCQETTGGNSEKGILMNSRFAVNYVMKGLELVRGASPVSPAVSISTNIIYQANYNNTFTFESAGAENKFYIKNNVNYYIGNSNGNSGEEYLSGSFIKFRNNNIINTVTLQDNGSWGILGSYEQNSDGPLYLGFDHNSGRNRELFFYGANNGYGGNMIYLYEEIDGQNVPEENQKQTAPMGAIGDENDGNGEFIYGTFSSNKNVKFDEGVNAYIVKELTNTHLNLIKVPNNTVPANTGVILKTIFQAPQDVQLYYAPYEVLTGEVPAVDENNENMLRPASEEKPESGYKYYMLSYGTQNLTPTSLGFYWGAPNGGKFTSREGSAYLRIPSSVNVKGFTFAYFDDETDGIINLKQETRNEKHDSVIYNLAGQRISQPVHGQIYIMNGHKFIAK